jgi:RimJ/RimL family protein N-acetyltransferase
VDCFEIKPTLRTERLTIRPMRADDAAALLASTEEPESRRLTGTHHRFTLEQTQAWCSSRDEQNDRWDLVIEDAADGAWLGELAVNDWDPDNRSCGIRIALEPHARGHGIGPEAMSAVIDHLFTATPAHRLELDVYSINPRAIAVYEHLGFVREGVKRDALLWDGTYSDAIQMSVLRPEWTGTPRRSEE